jgi:hypothetical protein
MLAWSVVLGSDRLFDHSELASRQHREWMTTLTTHDGRDNLDYSYRDISHRSDALCGALGPAESVTGDRTAHDTHDSREKKSATQWHTKAAVGRVEGGPPPHRSGG